MFPGISLSICLDNPINMLFIVLLPGPINGIYAALAITMKPILSCFMFIKIAFVFYLLAFAAFFHTP